MPDHDLNHVEVSGVLSKPPARAPQGLLGGELLVRIAGDKVLFVHLDLTPAQARLLDGLAPDQRVSVTGRLSYSKGLHTLVVAVGGVTVLPAGVTLSQGR